MNFLSTLSLLFANLINSVTAVFCPFPSLMMICLRGVFDQGGERGRLVCKKKELQKSLQLFFILLLFISINYFFSCFCFF